MSDSILALWSTSTKNITFPDVMRIFGVGTTDRLIDRIVSDSWESGGHKFNEAECSSSARVEYVREELGPHLRPSITGTTNSH